MLLTFSLIHLHEIEYSSCDDVAVELLFFLLLFILILWWSNDVYYTNAFVFRETKSHTWKA